MIMFSLFISAYIHLLYILWLSVDVSLSLTSGQLLYSGQLVLIPSAYPLFKMPWIQLVTSPDSGQVIGPFLRKWASKSRWFPWLRVFYLKTYWPESLGRWSSFHLVSNYFPIQLKSPTRWLWHLFVWQRNHLSVWGIKSYLWFPGMKSSLKKGIRNFLLNQQVACRSTSCRGSASNKKVEMHEDLCVFSSDFFCSPLFWQPNL